MLALIFAMFIMDVKNKLFMNNYNYNYLLMRMHSKTVLSYVPYIPAVIKNR